MGGLAPRLFLGLLLGSALLLGVHAWVAAAGRDAAAATAALDSPERFELPERPEIEVPEAGILLNYPHESLSLPQDGPRPNILVVVIDSLRADALRPEVMPTATRLALRGRSFRDHMSTGNATRFARSRVHGGRLRGRTACGCRATPPPMRSKQSTASSWSTRASSTSSPCACPRAAGARRAWSRWTTTA